jgi:hypothetical protein
MAITAIPKDVILNKILTEPACLRDCAKVSKYFREIILKYLENNYPHLTPLPGMTLRNWVMTTIHGPDDLKAFIRHFSKKGKSMEICFAGTDRCITLTNNSAPIKITANKNTIRLCEEPNLWKALEVKSYTVVAKGIQPWDLNKLFDKEADIIRSSTCTIL